MLHLLLGVSAPPLHRVKPFCLLVRSNTYHAVLAEHPEDKIDAFTGCERQCGVVLATKMQDAIAWSHLGEAHGVRRHLPRLIIEKARALEHQLAAREARHAEVDVEGEHRCVGMLSKSDILAHAVLDDKAVGIVRVASADELREEHPAERSEDATA
eukprot:CAMPEP_0119401000 /NCGR_PEP_ID=MMETSP1334-20130426/142148_2 /TAXON_ID=127549 /ORGANISM="Calcidiscus leptoporus, Strain RCC1130" /LENGTH=155 /DNA_ID=CAMNT_0007424909 /DNA_START=229 /DNA_END=696 /DNA_ORIENTATION=-